MAHSVNAVCLLSPNTSPIVQAVNGVGADIDSSVRPQTRPSNILCQDPRRFDRGSEPRALTSIEAQRATNYLDLEEILVHLVFSNLMFFLILETLIQAQSQESLRQLKLKELLMLWTPDLVWVRLVMT